MAKSRSASPTSIEQTKSLSTQRWLTLPGQLDFPYRAHRRRTLSWRRGTLRTHPRAFGARVSSRKIFGKFSILDAYQT